MDRQEQLEEFSEVRIVSVALRLRWKMLWRERRPSVRANRLRHRSYKWLVPALGTMCIIALLVAICTVVREGLRQGEARRHADALETEAAWRCNTLRISAQREDCLHRYRQELPDNSSGIQALVNDVARIPTRPGTP